MYDARIRDLMTRGYALANKWYFKEFNTNEFDKWIDDCKSLLSCCDPEPNFPDFPTVSHVEEIVMLLGRMSAKIARGEVEYLGIL
jgi:hypothetical protein